jgi:hypothetical protein
VSKTETEVNPGAKNGRIFFADNEDKAIKGMYSAERKAKYPLVDKLQSDPGKHREKKRLSRGNGHGKGRGGHSRAHMGMNQSSKQSRAEHHRAYSRCVLQTIQAKPSSIRTPPNTPINPT